MLSLQTLRCVCAVIVKWCHRMKMSLRVTCTYDCVEEERSIGYTRILPKIFHADFSLRHNNFRKMMWNSERCKKCQNKVIVNSCLLLHPTLRNKILHIENVLVPKRDYSLLWGKNLYISLNECFAIHCWTNSLRYIKSSILIAVTLLRQYSKG